MQTTELIAMAATIPPVPAWPDTKKTKPAITHGCCLLEESLCFYLITVG